MGNTDPFMEEVILTELAKNKEIRSIKSKTVAVIPKQKVIKPVIPTNITLLELKISQIFCEIHKVNIDNIYSHSRKRTHVDARMQLVSFLYFYREYTYSDVGRLMNKDHSTIIHNVKKHQDLIETNGIYTHSFYRALETLKEEMPELFVQDEEKKQEMYVEFVKIKLERKLRQLEKTYKKNNKECKNQLS
jgi:chromosomal replication initiation ATPase DnaA